jgi:PAS domain S-box-containing protein
MMKREEREELLQRNRTWLIILVISTVFVLLANFVGLLYGITIVLPHLLYLPIVITSYRFPRRGILFSLVLGLTYTAMVYTILYPDLSALPSAISRTVVFVAIGGVVAYLSLNLKMEQERYRGLFEHSEAGTFLVGLDDEQLVIEEVNSRGAEILGYAVEDLTGTSLLRYWDDEEGREKVFEQIKTQGAAHYIESHMRSAENDALRLIISAGKLLDDRIIFSIVDITERRQAEDALKEANKKLNLLGRITRSDLFDAVSRLSVSLEKGISSCETPVMVRYLKTLRDLAGAIQRRVEQTRDYQDLGATPPEWHRVQDMIQGVASQIDTGGMSLRVWVERLDIYADNLLGRVFYNLLDNAARHGHKTSEIIVTYHVTSTGLDLYVEDNGSGIPEDRKQSIFEYGTANMGFGLYISREILGITGITIEEKGIFGEGASFVIHVPSDAYRIQ